MQAQGVMSWLPPAASEHLCQANCSPHVPCPGRAAVILPPSQEWVDTLSSTEWSEVGQVCIRRIGELLPRGRALCLGPATRDPWHSVANPSLLSCT